MAGVSIATGVTATDPGQLTNPSLAPDGTAALPGYAFSAAASWGIWRDTGYGVSVSVGGTASAAVGTTNLFLPAGSSLSWLSGTFAGATSADLNLSRDATAVLALSNATIAQTFRVYGTTTGPKYTFVTHDGTNGKIDANSGTVGLGGTAAGIVKGTATNDSATAGYVGEHIATTVASASAVGLTTATSANMTSISLTAGDWDVSATVMHKLAATTTATILSAGISQTTATLPTVTAGDMNYSVWRQVSAANGGDVSQTVGPFRISLSGTTTIFCVVNDTFTTSTNAAYGTLRARRVR